MVATEAFRATSSDAEIKAAGSEKVAETRSSDMNENKVVDSEKLVEQSKNEIDDEMPKEENLEGMPEEREPTEERGESPKKERSFGLHSLKKKLDSSARDDASAISKKSFFSKKSTTSKKSMSSQKNLRDDVSHASRKSILSRKSVSGPNDGASVHSMKMFRSDMSQTSKKSISFKKSSEPAVQNAAVEANSDDNAPVASETDLEVAVNDPQDEGTTLLNKSMNDNASLASKKSINSKKSIKSLHDDVSKSSKKSTSSKKSWNFRSVVGATDEVSTASKKVTGDDISRASKKSFASKQTATLQEAKDASDVAPTEPKNVLSDDVSKASKKSVASKLKDATDEEDLKKNLHDDASKTSKKSLTSKKFVPPQLIEEPTDDVSKVSKKSVTAVAAQVVQVPSDDVPEALKKSPPSKDCMERNSEAPLENSPPAEPENTQAPTTECDEIAAKEESEWSSANRVERSVNSEEESFPAFLEDAVKAVRDSTASVVANLTGLFNIDELNKFATEAVGKLSCGHNDSSETEQEIVEKMADNTINACVQLQQHAERLEMGTVAESTLGKLNIFQKEATATIEDKTETDCAENDATPDLVDKMAETTIESCVGIQRQAEAININEITESAFETLIKLQMDAEAHCQKSKEEFIRYAMSTETDPWAAHSVKTPSANA